MSERTTFKIILNKRFPTTKEIEELEKKHHGILINVSPNLKNRTVTLTFEMN